MWKKLACLFGAAFMAGSASAGPLTNIFLESLENQGKASWSEGYQEGHVETLNDVVLDLENGRRYDIDVLTLHHSGNSFLMEAENLRMNPEGDILLLRVDRLSFAGHPGVLKSFWTLDMITDSCALIGLDSDLRIENLGLILEGGDDVLSEDAKYHLKSLELETGIEGSLENCNLGLDFMIAGYEAFLSDGSSHVVEHLDVSMNLPGSVNSLVVNPERDVTLDLEVNRVRDLIPGGATAWSIEKGEVAARFSVLGLVSGLNLSLKQMKSGDFGMAYGMRLWNALNGLRGDLSFVAEGASARSANILPPASVKGFTDVGLTTLLFDMKGGFDIIDKAVNFTAGIDLTGLAGIRASGVFRVGTYPDRAIERVDGESIPFDSVPPVYLDKLNYAQADGGLISAAETILGVPVTVWINRIREEQSERLPEISHITRQIATGVANFVSLSRNNPPARLDLSVGGGLDLRQALIVSGEAPANIPDIFTFSVLSGPVEAAEETIGTGFEDGEETSE